MKDYEITYNNGNKMIIKAEVAFIQYGYVNALTPDVSRNGTSWEYFSAANITSIKEVK